MTTFGKVMAGILVMAMIVAGGCAVLIIEGIELNGLWTALAISAVISLLIATAFNLEGRRK